MNYGEMVLTAEERENYKWDEEKERIFEYVDLNLDYIWDIKEDGSIVLTDRGYDSGICDSITQSREKNNTLVMTFSSLEELKKEINNEKSKLTLDNIVNE
jgi:hypothetical protein